MKTTEKIDKYLVSEKAENRGKASIEVSFDIIVDGVPSAPDGSLDFDWAEKSIRPILHKIKNMKFSHARFTNVKVTGNMDEM